MWIAYFQADGEMRHTIAVSKFRNAAEHAREEFVKRMASFEPVPWWTWVEETDADTVVE